MVVVELPDASWPTGRRVARCAAALTGLALLVGACGDAPLAGPFAVAERGLRWELDEAARAAVPVALAWEAGSALPPWVALGAEGPTGPPPWRLSGGERAVLESPAGVQVDPEDHGALAVQARVPSGTRLVLRWADGDAGFDAERLFVAGTGETGSDGVTRWAVPLDQLVGRTRDAALRPGRPARLELSWMVPESTEPVAVEVLVLALLPQPGAEGAVRRVERLGVSLDGQSIAAGSAARLPLRPGPRDRLRLWLAATGEVRVRLSDGERRLPPAEVALAAGAAWHALALDLAPLGGRPATLTLETTSTGAGPARVFVGGSMLLRPSADARPNVLLYVEDTLRADRLSVYGCAEPTDPRLAELAAGGVTFERVQAASNWTRASLTSLLTSLPPPRHGNVARHLRLSDGAHTLAEAFAAGGWLTASFVTNVHGGAHAGLDQGFDVSAEPHAFAAADTSSTLTSEALAGPLDAWLEAHADERLFVHVHSMDPHAPYEPTLDDLAPLAARVPQRAPLRAAADGEVRSGPDIRVGPQREALERDALRYDAEVRHNDARLGRLADTLARLGLDQRTLVAFTADHGESFDEHGWLGHKVTLFQEELAVPWVLWWPGTLPAGRRVAEPVGHVDLAPTLAGLAGVARPAAWEGRDLSPTLLRGETLRDAPLVSHFVSAETDIEQAAVLQGSLKLVLDLRDEAWRPIALYDLADDPFERRNRLGDPGLAEARSALAAWALTDLAPADDVAQDARALDPATADWLRAMGYLGK